MTVARRWLAIAIALIASALAVRVALAALIARDPIDDWPAATHVVIRSERMAVPGLPLSPLQPPPAEAVESSPAGLTADLARAAVELPAGTTWPRGAVVGDRDGSVLVLVPAGRAVFGSALPDAPSAEKPQFRATLPAYYISVTEVTNAQYERFVQATGHPSPDPGLLGSGFSDWSDGRVRTGLGNHPVAGVSWGDARSYCARAGLRLPCELEWEKAARGTDGRNYPWGSTWDESVRRRHSTPGRADRPVRRAELGVLAGLGPALRGAIALCAVPCADGAGLSITQPVGSSPAALSPYGLLDTVGSLSEWCEDWYDENVYARYARGEVAPPPSGEFRVLRGAPWSEGPSRCRSSSRDAADPAYGYFTYGFRAARDAEP